MGQPGRRARTFGLSLAVVVLAGTAGISGSAPVGASSPWQATNVAPPSGGSDLILEGAVLYLRRHRVAVGDYDDTSNNAQVTAATESKECGDVASVSSYPANMISPLLSAVSCSQLPASGPAVGNIANSSGVIFGFAVTEAGGTWTTGVVVNAPVNTGSPALYAVSCSSAGNCSAVGEYGFNIFAANEVGGAWNQGVDVQRAIRREFLGTLFGVSCTGIGTCTGVGATSIRRRNKT